MPGILLVLALLGAPQSSETDVALEEAVRNAVLEDPNVRSYALVVEVDENVAVIRGVVGSNAARQSAADTAHAVAGIDEVVNGLIVRPEVQLTDTEIELYVDQALSRDRLVDSHEIVVTVLDGVVELHGTVDDDAEKERAERVAERVLGVKGVENDLTLSPVPSTRDAMLERRIAEKLDEAFDGLTVRVDRGVVTISGTVGTRDDKRRAEQIAFDAGATLVKNLIRVE